MQWRGVGEEIGAQDPSDNEAALMIYLAIVGGRLKIMDTIEHENGEREYRLRDTDYRDIEHINFDPTDPIDYDNPDDGFDNDWDPDTAVA